MKKLIFVLLVSLLPVLGFSQLTTINPDTVCIGTSGSIYQVTPTPGYVYNWTLTAPGVVTSGAGTNSITADWSAAGPGLIPGGVTVIATDPTTGCTSAPVTLDVFILNVVPTITAIGPFCAGDPCVNLVGTPAGGTFSGPGVVGGQFCPGTAGTGTHTITYTYVQNGCTFTATTTVTVNPIPTLSPISHN